MALIRLIAALITTTIAELGDEQQEEAALREREQLLAALDEVGDARRHEQPGEHPDEGLGQERLGETSVRLDAEGGRRTRR